MDKKLAVIALGGNALLRGDQLGTIEEQEQNTTDTLENLVFLIKEGYDLVITHGNGPQVGNILMRNDAGEQMYGIAQSLLIVDRTSRPRRPGSAGLRRSRQGWMLWCSS
ncbi:MAG: hypothetical protein MUC30_07580, partial [Bacteroidales bacterium]|nr:hypothetical protein [Bacteroidales bacterium]